MLNTWCKKKKKTNLQVFCKIRKKKITVTQKLCKLKIQLNLFMYNSFLGLVSPIWIWRVCKMRIPNMPSWAETKKIHKCRKWIQNAPEDFISFTLTKCFSTCLKTWRLHWDKTLHARSKMLTCSICDIIILLCSLNCFQLNHWYSLCPLAIYPNIK